MNTEDYENYEAQSELNQQNIEGQQLPYSPQMAEQMHQAQAVLVEQTNPKKVVETVMLRIQGQEREPNGELKEISSPKMNKLGIEKIWFILDSHINQNIILSHLDEFQIGKIMIELSNDLVDNLSLNWKEYGIKDKTDLDDINNSVLVNIYVCLKRAEGQNEKNWLGKISIEQISGGQRFGKQKKESLWAKFRL